MNLATNQRAQRREPNQRYMCHLDHLLQLPWAHPSARAAHLSTRAQTDTPKNGLDCGASEDLKV